MNDYSSPTTIGEVFAEALIGNNAKKQAPRKADTGYTEHSNYPPRLVDISEACELLHCSRSLLYRFIGAQEIIPIKLGRLTKIPLASIDAFISAKLDAALIGR